MERAVCKCSFDEYQIVVFYDRLIAARQNGKGSIEENSEKKEFFFVEMDQVKIIQREEAVYLCFTAPTMDFAGTPEDNPYAIKMPQHMREAAVALQDYIEVRIEKMQNYPTEFLHSPKEMNEAPEMKVLRDRMATISKKAASSSKLLTGEEAREKLEKYQKKDKTFLKVISIGTGVFILFLVGIVVYAIL